MKEEGGAWPMARGAVRVNGRHNESMWVSGEEFCFRSGNSTHKMGMGELKALVISNVEDARAAADEPSLAPCGTWTEGDRSGGGYHYLIVKSATECWIMEITQAQVSNARSFVQQYKPAKDKTEGHDVPTRVINTPKGALLTVGFIACVFIAILLVFTLEQPLIGLVVAIIGLVMWFNIK